jgi:putative Mn2+ efflux pump MntP
MEESSLLIGGLVLSVTHAIIPTHWMPFVLVGKVEGWSLRKVMGTLLLAGGGHVGGTLVLGMIAGMVGKVIMKGWEVSEIIPIIILIMVGGVYILRGIGKREGELSKPHKEIITVFSLFLMLTLTPCEPMVLVYFAGCTLGVRFLIILSIIVAIGTLFSMSVLTFVGFKVSQEVKFQLLEKYEHQIIGGILILLGILSLLWR